MKFSRYIPLSPSTASGDGEIRTHDPLLARQVLSQLSYAPIMGLSGLEPPTSRLSGVRSNRLSYKPILVFGVVTLIPTVVEMRRIELLTSCLQGRRSPS